jgi:glyoxylase-like metal-dependent hydrolase (beta-lactamase superfamily II)
MNVIKLGNSPYDANAYLVDGNILVDVGIDGGYIISELEKHIKLENLETIILTHCHYDHSAGSGAVAEFTGAKIAIHKDDAPLLKNARTSAAQLFGDKAPHIEPDILLKGGEFFGELEVIHTPGHTPGGICLYSREAKILFSGDTVFPEGSFGRTDLYGGNASRLLESIKKLTLLEVEVVYPGHGYVIKNNAREQIKMSLMMASQYSDLI